MVPHPDGSNRVFLSNQPGKIWLATIPSEQSNMNSKVMEAKPFLDITDNVLFGTEFGLMGMAFHPNFVQNGRFFLSYNCDKLKHPRCSGRCACNTDVACDPARLGSDNGISPCQYLNVVAEFTVNGTASKPSLAKSASPLEVRRIFTMGLPYKGGHAGQILFGPADGYLYVMTGDGSDQDDPYNFAQNKKSLLGKILRLDIDNLPSDKEMRDQDLWGNYSIPRDNPYINDKDLELEIWALGLRNPWRCSFDSERPSYFLCGDTGQDQYEEIDLIVKGGNYGWRVYEGPILFHPLKSPGGNTSSSSINSIFPVLGYNHSEVDKKSGSASITGGYFYRSMTDPCMYGRYVYTDLYAFSVWVGMESLENSRNFTSAKIPFRCAHNSPMQCTFVDGNPMPALGYIFSLAEDNNKDLFFLTTTGVYRVARPSHCNFKCSKSSVTASVNDKLHSSSSMSQKNVKGQKPVYFLLFLLLPYPAGLYFIM
ncbi:HIPL1 protein [Quillaja saponaria]|uniref:HIPL1 protein n=1 Tax=Quillaja saponaria TaxID=32244 RepID=A0AAD7LDV2_QUISA|nr:HIPL1 protein [Quillaja saponaria]